MTADRDDVRRLEEDFQRICTMIAEQRHAHRRSLAQFEAAPVDPPSPRHDAFAREVVAQAAHMLGLDHPPPLRWVEDKAAGFAGFCGADGVALVASCRQLAFTECGVTAIHETVHAGRPDWSDEAVEEFAQRTAPTILAAAQRVVGPAPWP